MRASAILITLAATVSLGWAEQINMHCNFAADNTGMMQQPYCCRDMQPALNNPKANMATDCVELKTPQLCEDRSRPACCYTIGPKKICTSHVIFMNAADI